MSDTDHPVFNDRYEVHSRIGRGGMADVFLARDRLLDRPVAVKVLFPEYATDPSFVERFRREAQSAANLTHPNVVGVYDWGRQGSTYFIVMEYVNGRSLADILRADGVILPQRAADIAFDVAGALGFAHASNVVHRDVKPGNILVNPAGAVKVADFGIARALNSAHEQDLTQAGAVMGTATYFSPEQAQGSTPDPRSDLYSLGIVMYEMVCGKPPFTGDNPVAIAYKQVHEMPRRLRDVAPEVPADYEAIVMKLLSKSPSNRYADGDELRADLKRFRDGLPVSASPRPAATVVPVAPTTINAPVTPARGTEIVRPAAATTVQPRQEVEVVRHQPSRVSNDPMIAQPQRPPARPAPTGPAYDDEPKRTGWYIAAGVLVLALAGLLTWFLTNSNKTATAPAEVQVTIPTDLINQPKDVVEQQLRKLKLVPILEGRNTDQAVLNNVFQLDPPGGSIVNALSEVKVIYNSGPNKKAIINFVGGTDVAAKTNLTALGLPFVINGVESADKPAGTVIAQDPPPGDYPPGTKVTLTVSNGVTQITLPNIALKGRDAVVSELTALGLKPSVELAASDTVEKDKVIGYKPDQAPTVAKDSPIVVLVSSGIGDQVVPGLAGLTQDEAFAKIQEAGFLVGNAGSKDVLLGGPEDGKVVAQDPPANAKAAKKSKIIVTIGRGVAPATTTTLAPATTTTIAATTTTVAPAPSFGVAVTVKKTGAADSNYAKTATAGATASYTWRIVVSNTGNTTLSGFTINSTVPACTFTPDPFDVAAGASKTFECTTGGISAIGPLTNTATVKPTASSAGGVPGPKSDGATATTTAP